MSDNQKSTPVVGEYKGSPTITLNPESKFSFTFGLGKAKLIVEHFEAIKAFVEKGGK